MKKHFTYFLYIFYFLYIWYRLIHVWIRLVPYTAFSHMYMCVHIHMGWLRLVGSLKLQVSLENIGLFCRALLKKRPIMLRSLLIGATPYTYASGLSLVQSSCLAQRFVCVLLHMCIYVYIYVHSHLHTHMYIHIWTYNYVQTHMYIHICGLHIHIAYTYAHTHMYIHTAYTYVHTHMYIHIYTCTYVHTHMRSPPLSGLLFGSRLCPCLYLYMCRCRWVFVHVCEWSCAYDRLSENGMALHVMAEFRNKICLSLGTNMHEAQRWIRYCTVGITYIYMHICIDK